MVVILLGEVDVALLGSFDVAFGSQAQLLHLQELLLLLLQVLLSVELDQVGDLLLLGFYFIELAAVPVVHGLYVLLDAVLGRHPVVQELVPVRLLHFLVEVAGRLQHDELLLLEGLHFLHKLVAALHVLYSLVRLLLLLPQLDDSRLYLLLLLLHSFVVDHRFHHIRLAYPSPHAQP